MEPESLAEIAMLRVQRDASTPFLLTIDEREPFDVSARSYGEIAERALALAGEIAAAGVSRGQRVGCYMSNRPCWVVGALGSWWAGCAIAAVGTLLPGPEAAVLFDLAGIDTVVAEGDAPELPDRFKVIKVDSEGRLVDAPQSATGVGVDVVAEVGGIVLPRADELAVVFFTSGTTGRPKGITYAHADVMMGAKRVASSYARNPGYRPDPAPAHLAPGVVFNAFGHTAGFGRVAFRMWIGRPSVLVAKFTVGAARAYLNRCRPDSLQLSPAMVHMLASTEEDLDLTGVTYVTSGTAPLPVAVRDRFESRFGVPVMQAYGMTEIGVVAQERLDDVLAGRRGPGSVGRLAQGVEVRIQPLDDTERPDGEGEILARARTLPSEFVGGTKVPVDAEGWYATGDVGRFDDGILYITGRSVDKLIVGGFNVYPAEVEDVARRSPLVKDAVVVGVADDRLGERPVAGIVWAGEPDQAALSAHLRESLAHYKAPRHFFTLDAVPVTARDKVDRRKATELATASLAHDTKDSAS